MCSYPFRKTAKLEEILLDKTIVHNLIIKDLVNPAFWCSPCNQKFASFIEINQNLTKNKQK